MSRCDSIVESVRNAFVAANVLRKKTKKYAYGTAGFRERYDEEMHQLFMIIGVLAALRSISVDGKCVGVMITASHNLGQDNGVKIVDQDGGMLVKSWEQKAEMLVNLDFELFLERLKDIIVADVGEAKLNVPATVMLSSDCRSSSPVLMDFVKRGIAAVSNSRCLELGEEITPVIHFCVFSYNQSNRFPQFDSRIMKQFYFDTLLSGYLELLETTPSKSNIHPVVLDSAYGVGSVTVSEFLSHCIASGHHTLGPWAVELRNKVNEGPVNEDCGAEHVQKLRVPPANVSAEKDLEKLISSFDGDGDRIVFHYFPRDSSYSSTTLPTPWILLDGDRIATLFAYFLSEELKHAGLTDRVVMGIVQTAYGNGSSTAFLKSMNVPIYLAKTGVKYLHHKAKDLDVGVYFEANGHGTVLFSDKFRDILNHIDTGGLNEHAKLAVRRLQSCLKLINPTVGDALSDFLCTLAILTVLDMSHSDWNGMYKELPSKQVKLEVADKNKLKCSDDETHLISPLDLQKDIDKAASKVRAGRCFIRPSGTENVVRIYAEAETVEEVDQIVAEVKDAIERWYSANAV